MNAEYGVVYFGDGCWGIFLENCEAKYLQADRNIFADYSVSQDQHVWVLQLNQTYATYFAYRPNGTLMSPPYYQNLANYQTDF